MAIEVIKPGLSTSVQDLGRPGYYHLGIAPSGAADLYAARAANLLVGNDENAAVLECTYMGPELAFQRDAMIAVTGAELPPQLNGDARPRWESFPVKQGDVLGFGFITAGARVFIAVSGGIDVPLVMGSRSTYSLSGFGGFEGRVLAAGDILPLGAGANGMGAVLSVPDDLRGSYPKELEVRVMPSLYDGLLTDEGRRTFFETDWVLTPVANRTGFRYQGPPLEFMTRKQPFGAGSDPSNITDGSYPVGSIQVPGGIEPILLHRDAVTGGGYAVIATVISADMDRVAQSAPNSKTRFVEVNMETALAARHDYQARLGQLRAALDGQAFLSAAVEPAKLDGRTQGKEPAALPMSDLRIFSYLPNPRIWKATIAARLCGVDVEVRGASPPELQDWLWDFDAHPLTADERAAGDETEQQARAGFTGRLHKTAAFMEAHPFGTVPAAFSPNGAVGIFESNSIMRAVARLGADACPLYGADPYQAARIDSFLDASLVFARDGQIYLLGLMAGNADPDVYARTADAFGTYLDGIERALTPDPDFLVGDGVTLADICFVAELTLFSVERARARVLADNRLSPIFHDGVGSEFPRALAHYEKLCGDPAFSPDVAPYLEKIERTADQISGLQKGAGG